MIKTASKDSLSHTTSVEKGDDGDRTIVEIIRVLVYERHTSSDTCIERKNVHFLCQPLFSHVHKIIPPLVISGMLSLAS